MPTMSKKQLLDAVADVLQCWCDCEGTWYERDWRSYGVSEAAQREIMDAWRRKYGDLKKGAPPCE